MTVIIDPDFNPVPSLDYETDVSVTDSPDSGGAVAIWVTADGDLPAELTVTREELQAAGFTAKKNQTLVLPGTPTRVVVGLGSGANTAAKVRDAAASFTRAAAKHSVLSLPLDAFSDVQPAAAAAAAVEGVLLSRYAYEPLKNDPKLVRVERITLVSECADRREAATRGAVKGEVLSRTAKLARDLGNTPPRHLNAVKFAEVAERLAPQFGLEVEVYDRAKAIELGLGGLLGVNAGSVQEPRVIKLSYKPESPKGQLALVGKGIMYDSGGISLKPSNPSHVSMKMDMMGAAAVFSAMTALRDLGAETAVTGWLMCTDNMPSGSATKLGDVLTMRSGKTVEVHNTDAEGRLVLGDGIALAVEAEPRPDAVVDIATLTGAAMMALGTETTALFANNTDIAEQLKAASASVDDTVWQMPLDLRMKEAMQSNVADMRNLGAPEGGAITAALFLNEFVDGVPWAHLDIAGPMEVKSDKLWRSAGSTGVGARLLAEFAVGFNAPTGAVTGTEIE